MVNEDQLIFNQKNLLVDKKGLVIPQVFNKELDIFEPYTNNSNSIVGITEQSYYQKIMEKKEILVDSQGRAIPQFYDTEEGLFKPLTKDNGNSGNTSNLGNFKFFYNKETESLDLLFDS